jgi:hypothetical protein
LLEKIIEFFSNIMTEIVLLLVSFLFAKIFQNDFRYEYQGKIRIIRNVIIICEIIKLPSMIMLYSTPDVRNVNE